MALTQSDIDDVEASIKAVVAWAEGNESFTATMPNGRQVPSPAKVIADSLLFKDAIAWPPGGTVTDATQTYSNGGMTYAPHPSLLPFSGSGAFPSTSMYLLNGVQSGVLASQSSTGSQLVGFFNQSVETALLSMFFQRDTLAQAISDVTLFENQRIKLKERLVGKGGGAFWDVVLSSSVTTNTYNIVQCTGAPTLALVLRTTSTINAIEIGADPTGVTSSSGAFQAANDALPSDGGTIFGPAGTYKLDIASGVDLFSNVTLKGDGDRTLLVLGGALAVKAESKTNVCIRDFKVLNESYFIYFKESTGVDAINITGQGLETVGGDFSERGIQYEACDDIYIENCDFDNYNYAVFFRNVSGGSVPCGTVRIKGGVYQHSDISHGIGLNNPVGVNGFEVKRMYVEGATFKNIKPSSGTYFGFGVYEGDSNLGLNEIVKVTGCHFIDDDGYTANNMMGVLTSLADVSTIHDCEFHGDFQALDARTKTLTVSDCLFDGSWCITASVTGNIPIIHTFDNNVWDDVDNFPLISMNGQAGGNLPVLRFTSNSVNNTKFGIYIRFTDYAHLTGNTLIDLNTDGIVDTTAGSGFNFSGAQEGFVDGNTIMNGVGGGLMEYGVSAGSTHEIIVTANNNIRGMVTGAFRNTFSAAPTIGSWDVGNELKYWGAAAGGVPGTVCTTSGTQGTLNGGSTTGGITTGTTSLVVNTVTELKLRQKITIAGVTGIKTIVGISGTTVTIDSNADATVSGAAVAWSNATFKSLAALAA